MLSVFLGSADQFDLRTVQVSLVFIFVCIVFSYFLITTTLPFLYSRMSMHVATSRALAEVQRAANDRTEENRELAAELDSYKTRAANTKIEKRNRNAQHISLVPTVPPDNVDQGARGRHQVLPEVGLTAVPGLRYKQKYRIGSGVEHQPSSSPSTRGADRLKTNGATKASGMAGAGVFHDSSDAPDVSSRQARQRWEEHTVPASTTDYVSATALPLGAHSGIKLSRRESLIAAQDAAFMRSAEIDLEKIAQKQLLAGGEKRGDAKTNLCGFVLEPEPEAGEGVVSIVFKFHRYQHTDDPIPPLNEFDGSANSRSHGAQGPLRVHRRFKISSLVGSLFLFIESCDRCPRHYDVFTSFPKRNITICDIARQFSELDITTNCIVDVQETAP